MNDESKEVAHPTFRMWLRPGGIVHLNWAPGVAIELAEAVAATEAIAGSTEGRRTLALIDAGEGTTQDRAARLEFALRHDPVSAVALVVGTPISRMMGTFFLSVSKPVAATRLFDDEASAIAWLQGFAE
jgi:hypothetical protein